MGRFVTCAKCRQNSMAAYDGTQWDVPLYCPACLESLKDSVDKPVAIVSQSAAPLQPGDDEDGDDDLDCDPPVVVTDP